MWKSYLLKALTFILALLLIPLYSCAPPVLKKELVTQAHVIEPAELRQAPESFIGRLFLFGGMIVNVKNQQEGSQLEGVYVLTDRKGYLREGEYRGRFIAKSKEFLDPVIYKTGRSVTIAGEFRGFEKGKIGEMEYDYPIFEIKEIYLWPEEKTYQVPPPWWYDPWYYPWDPWWRYRYPYWW
jgi:outer membrane lipoprotein